MLVITATDNGDGSVTFGTTGNAAFPVGATLRVYSFTGGQLAPWNSFSVYPGDNGFTVPRGSYVAYAFRNDAPTDVSAPVYFFSSVTFGEDPPLSVATRLRACVKARFSLVNTPIGGRWHEQIIPDENNVVFPCGLLTVDGLNETYTPKLSGKDDWIRPVKVMICDRCDQYQHDRLPDYELWRERLMRSVSQQRIPGLPESVITTIEPLIIVDPNMPKFQFLVSGFVVRAQTREARGLNV